MEKIIMIVGVSKDMLNAYSDDCESICAGGDTIEEVKADTEEAIRLIKKCLRTDGLNKLKVIMNRNEDSMCRVSLNTTLISYLLPAWRK